MVMLVHDDWLKWRLVTGGRGPDVCSIMFLIFIIHDLVQLIPCILTVALFDGMLMGPFIFLTNAPHVTTVLLCLGIAAILSVAGGPRVCGKRDTSGVSN